MGHGGRMTDGQVALVTGAGRGIGRQIALRLALAGFRVGLVSRSADELATTADQVHASADVPVVCVTGDVADAEDVNRICDTVTGRLGEVDLLVNNAGYYGSPGPFLDADIGQWWRVLETNLLGPVLLNKRVLPGMLARRSGRVVTMNSRAAVEDGDPAVSSSAYAVSKAAALRLDIALAHELAGSGVAMFSLSPGLVRTGMAELRPDIDQIPEESFLPARAAADVVVALASGRYDRLHGRFLHATDDLDALVEAVEARAATRTLALAPVVAHARLLGGQ
jgi:3-oxoacyl-[acyl-carrier protein] reductase